MMTIKLDRPPQPVNDNEIVQRVLHGEKDAYELLIRKHNQRLYRIARAYLKNEDDIEDVMQEAYIKAYEQLPRFEMRAAFSTWLVRILINEALARVKHMRRFESGDVPADNPESRRPEHYAPTDTPVENLMNSELKEILERAVDGLPEKYRAVFVMREIEGMSVAETGASLDISVPNVKVRLNRAKGMLQNAIGSLYHDAGVFDFNLVRCDRIVEGVMRRLPPLVCD